jgi:NADPH:quinone reductase-like Zn-dependent oxidoreductase
MKAVVLHQHGGPEELKYEDVPNPTPGPGEVLVRVHAASLNPIDWKLRSGEARRVYELSFPDILGRDVAGTVESLGEGVSGFVVGEHVLALANHPYAELCIVKAADLAHTPEGLGFNEASTVPLASLTGHQLVHLGAKVQEGQTILLTGALGSVGRCALFAALEAGANVIAAVRKTQVAEALAIGAAQAIDLADEAAILALPYVDAVADTVGHDIATRLLAKVKPGGNFGSVLGPVAGSSDFPEVTVNMVSAKPDPATVAHFATAVQEGRLKLPIGLVLPLAKAAEAQIAAEKGGIGKVILTP